jgi:hypothetical protein
LRKAVAIKHHVMKMGSVQPCSQAVQSSPAHKRFSPALPTSGSVQPCPQAVQSSPALTRFHSRAVSLLEVLAAATIQVM